jgi:hypothetical protein
MHLPSLYGELGPFGPNRGLLGSDSGDEFDFLRRRHRHITNAITMSNKTPANDPPAAPPAIAAIFGPGDGVGVGRRADEVEGAAIAAEVANVVD